MAKKTYASYMVLGAILAATMFVGLPNIYTIANLLGINMAPSWYQSIVSYVSAGGTIAQAFAAILGVVVPGWALAVVSGFGLASA